MAETSLSEALITLEWPSTPSYRALGRLVLGGIAARADLPVDRVDELGLALDTLSRVPVHDGHLRLEVDAFGGSLRISVGSFPGDPLADASVSRVVVPLVDSAQSVSLNGEHHVVLVVAAGGQAAR